jgi:hypothetical protein
MNVAQRSEMGRFCRIGDARGGSGSPCDAADGATGHNQAHSEKLEKFNGRNEVVPVVCAVGVHSSLSD